MNRNKTFKKNWLEHGYRFLFTFFQIYKKGYLTEEEYSKYKRTVFKNKLWQEEFKHLSKRKLQKYNIDAWRALIKLFYAGGLTKDEYEIERQKISIGEGFLLS